MNQTRISCFNDVNDSSPSTIVNQKNYNMDQPKARFNDSRKINVGLFKDKNVEYVQPPKRQPIVYRKPHETPTSKMDLDTTYHLSYMPVDNTQGTRLLCKPYERPLEDMGSYEFDSITKLSYMPVKGKVRKPFYPRSCLTLKGCHDMMTTQSLSYSDPGLVKTVPQKSFRGEPITIPMNCATVMKESYKPYEVLPIRKLYKPPFWQTEEKTDYHTTSKLSFQNVTPQMKRVPCKGGYRPPITGQMETCTTYDLSYQVPGSFRVRR